MFITNLNYADKNIYIKKKNGFTCLVKTFIGSRPKDSDLPPINLESHWKKNLSKL